MGVHRAESRRIRRLIGASIGLIIAMAVSLVAVIGNAGGTPVNSMVNSVKDTFARTVTDGWGQADIGGSWTLNYPKGTRPFNIAAGAATVSPLVPGRSTRASLEAVRQTDVDVSSRIAVPVIPPAVFGLYHALEARLQPDGSAYRGRVTVWPGGRLTLSFSRVNNGTETGLGEVAIPARLLAGQNLDLEFKVTGSNPVNLAVQAWPAGAPRPGWQYTIVDSSAGRIPSAGAVGIWDYLSSSAQPSAIRYSAFDAHPVPAGAPASWSAPISGAASGTPKTTHAPVSATKKSPVSSSSTGPATSTSGTSKVKATPRITPASPVGAGQGGRGAATLGSARYSLPSNTIYVSSAGGNDSQDGAFRRPLRTVARAISMAAAGQTIALRAGDYHEGSLFIPEAKAGLTIEAYPGETVWFDGSVPVSNWAKSRSAWVAAGWTAQFDHSASFTKGSDSGGFVNAAHPMAAWPDQLFVDGVQQQQVAAGHTVAAGQFAVDYRARTLTMGTNPAGHDVRATDLPKTFVVSAANVILRGFGIRRYATALSDGGTVYLARTGDSVSDVVLTDIAGQAISMFAGKMTIDHVTVLRTGMLGISGTQADGSEVSNSDVEQSNSEHFNTAPSSAGIKITRSRRITVSNNTVANGYDATGIWLDESVVGFNIVGNTLADNGVATHIMVELSDTGIVANNVVTGGDTGLNVYDSGNVQVYNNNFERNSRGSVMVAQDERRETTPGGNHDPRQPIPDVTCPWIARNITIANNVFGFNGDPYGFQIYAMDTVTHIPASRMITSISGNQFHINSATSDGMVGWGGSDNHSMITYQTPQALNAATGHSWVNARAGARLTVAESLAHVDNAIALPLPTAVAAAIGRPAGTKHVGAFHP